MAQVSQVRPGLFLSGLDPALKASVLSRRNIRLIVNASGIQEVTYPPISGGLEVVSVPVQDVPHAPLDQYFDPVSEKIHQNLVQNHGCLVHCTAGRSRSAALVLAYLIRFSALTLAEAHSVVLESRPFVRINAGFWRQLMEYERTLQNQTSVQMVQTESGVLPHVRVRDQDYCING